jgi:integrase
MKLNDNKIKAMKAEKKSQKFTDGGGLQLLVHPNGSKYFQFRYSFEKKDKLLSFGTYPEISLLEARDKAFELRKQVAKGKDPAVTRELEKELGLEMKANTFNIWSEKWHSHWKNSVSEPHADYTNRRLFIDINPFIGDLAVAKVSVKDIKSVFNRCVERGALDMAARVYQIISAVLQYVAEHSDKSHCGRNVAKDIKLSANIPHRERKNYARLPSAELPALMRAIEAYSGTPATRITLKLMPLVFLRTRELIEAPWEEIEWENKLWRIPKERMKSGSEHLVPLSDQTVELLQTLKIVTGHGNFMFPSRHGGHKCMSNNTILKALAAMGYKYEMTGHGFRGMARTELGEMGYPREWMEIQLAHLVGDETERAYNKAQFLEQRRKMMQDWADHLDKLKRGAKIFPFQVVN